MYQLFLEKHLSILRFRFFQPKHQTFYHIFLILFLFQIYLLNIFIQIIPNNYFMFPQVQNPPEINLLSVKTQSKPLKNNYNKSPKFNILNPKQYFNLSLKQRQQKAILHRQANIVNQTHLYDPHQRKQKLWGVEPNRHCNCCDQYKGQQLSLFIPLKQLNYLGMGPRPAFQYLKVLIILLIMGLAVAIPISIVNLVLNKQYLTKCSTKLCIYKLQTSRVAIQTENVFFIFIQDWLFLIYMFVCWLLIIFERKVLDEIIDQIDCEFLSPSDFAVKMETVIFQDVLNQIMNTFLCEVNIDKQLQGYLIGIINEYIQNNKQKQQKAQIIKILSNIRIQTIILPYSTVKFEEKLEKLDEYLFKMSSQQKQDLDQNKDLPQLIQQLDKQKKQFQNRTHRSISSRCFYVIFESVLMQRTFLKIFGHKQKLKDIFSYQNLCQKSTLKSSIISIHRAPQPQDIYWQNCSFKKNRWFKIINIFISFFLILTTFTVISYIKKLQNDSFKNPNSTGILPALQAISIIIINIVINIVLKISVILQRAHSRTQEIVSYTTRILIVQCLNTLLVPLIVNVYFVDGGNAFEGEQGFISTIFDLAISNIYIGPLIAIIDIPLRIKQLILYFQFSKKLILKMPLKKVFTFYEAPEMSLQQFYLQTLNIFIFTGFFIWINPTIIIFGIIALVIRYCLQKYFLLRKYKKHSLTSEYVIINMFSKFIGSILLLYAISGTKNLRSYIPPLIALILFLFYKFTYKQEEMVKMFQKKQSQQNIIQFDDLPTKPNQLMNLKKQTLYQKYSQYDFDGLTYEESTPFTKLLDFDKNQLRKQLYDERDMINKKQNRKKYFRRFKILMGNKKQEIKSNFDVLNLFADG